VRALVWRRLDAPGMEIAHVESFERATGTGSFVTDIEFDADGFVTLYHGFLERLS